MQKVGMRLTALGALSLVGGAAFGETLWYNGDLNGSSAIVVAQQNFATNSESEAGIYDDFIVNGNGWNVSSVFENVIMSSSDVSLVTSFNWQIYSGLTAGVGGTLVESGTTSVTVTPTGRTFNVSSGFGSIATPEYTVSASGLNFNLGPGTYWLGGTLGLSAAAGTYYVGTTSGANSIGSPSGNDGNSFYNGAALGANWVHESGDYSMGVGGTPTPAPEPFTLGFAAIGAADFLRRKVRATRKEVK